MYRSFSLRTNFIMFVISNSLNISESIRREKIYGFERTQKRMGLLRSCFWKYYSTSVITLHFIYHNNWLWSTDNIFRKLACNIYYAHMKELRALNPKSLASQMVQITPSDQFQDRKDEVMYAEWAGSYSFKDIWYLLIKFKSASKP